VDVNGADDSNAHLIGVLSKRLPEDVNGDGIVNMLDLWLVSMHYGENPSSPNWDPRTDVDKNNVVNMLDQWLVAMHFGETEP
jgi:hypothetical protein